MSYTLFLVRHGETPWSLSGQHTGLTDLSLTENGRLQSKALGEHLKCFSFSRVFTSPLKRAVESCQLAGLFDRAEIDASLVEWDYGDYEGLTHAEIMQRDPSWALFLKGAPGGETVEAACRRVDHFLDKLRDASGNICLFSSAHVLRLLTTRWLKISPSEGRLFILSPASLSILGHERINPVITRWNDISHYETLFQK
jgi:broad specificity phosphatase PhoE